MSEREQRPWWLGLPAPHAAGASCQTANDLSPKRVRAHPSPSATLAVQMVDAMGQRAMANPMYQSAHSRVTGSQAEDIMATASSLGGDYGEPAGGAGAPRAGGVAGQVWR